MGAFRTDMPVGRQITVVQTLLHGASATLHRGEVSEEEAPSLVRGTALAAVSV